MNQDLSNNLGINLNDPKFYPEKLLAKRMRALFITIPQTTKNYQVVHNKLKDYKQITFIATAEKQHQDEGTYIQIVMKLKQQVKLSQIHKLIDDTEGIVRGTINYQAPTDILQLINITTKGKYEQDGETPKQTGGQYKENDKTLEAIKLAQEGNLEEAIDIVREQNPLDYLKHKETLIENLRTENITREKFQLPDLSVGIKLRPYQEKVVKLLNETPKARRIIWVEGKPNAGKSFLINYLSNLENYKYGVYHAGQSIKFDDLAYNYDEEGAIVWDFPKAYDWQNLSNHAGQMIEKFSDYGQKISSKKYKGKTQHIRGHVLVCSNRPPIESILHRDIIHIKTDDEHHQEEEVSDAQEHHDLKTEQLYEEQTTTINDIDTPVDTEDEEEYYDDEDDDDVRHYRITKEEIQQDEILHKQQEETSTTIQQNNQILNYLKNSTSPQQNKEIIDYFKRQENLNSPNKKHYIIDKQDEINSINHNKRSEINK